MTEKDRKTVKDAEKCEVRWSTFSLEDLVSIIKRLDTQAVEQHDTIMNYRDEVGFLEEQLAVIREAGDFIELYVEYLNEQEVGDYCDIILTPGGNEITVLAKDFRRLSKALDGISPSVNQELKDQLAEVRAAGEPILSGLKFYKTCPDSIRLSAITEITDFTVGDLRRLAQALEEVKDE